MINSWRARQNRSGWLRSQADSVRNVHLAWSISPALAFRMACQLRTAAPVVKEEIQRLVQLNPKVVAHIPGAIDYLITRECITKDLPELKALSWFVSLSFLLV